MADSIVFTRPDGGVTVVVPVSGISTALVLKKDIPGDAVDITVVDSTTLLTDRTFRDAWVQAAGNITVDMPKARAIHAVHMAQIKVSETARLILAEVELRLQGNTVEADNAVTDKATLDGFNLSSLATQMAAAPNPTALKAIWPASLPVFS